MKSSFNAYGRSNSEYGPLHIPIWLGIVKRIPVGGTLDEDYNIAGALYPAGTPIQIKDKVITPFVGFKVTAYSAGGSEDTSSTITILPNTDFGGEILPEVGDLIQKLGATFAATGKAAAVTGVTALTGDDAGKYAVTVAKGAIDSLSAGNYVVFSAAESAGSSKSIAVQPNAYLFHDIWLGNLDVSADDTFATGAAVMYHPEGILIDRTPAAPFKELLAAAVPGVLQVNE